MLQFDTLSTAIFGVVNLNIFLLERGLTSEKVSLLAIAWDQTVQVAKLVKSKLKVVEKWTLESPAMGLAWLDDEV